MTYTGGNFAEGNAAEEPDPYSQPPGPSEDDGDYLSVYESDPASDAASGSASEYAPDYDVPPPYTDPYGGTPGIRVTASAEEEGFRVGSVVDSSATGLTVPDIAAVVERLATTVARLENAVKLVETVTRLEKIIDRLEERNTNTDA